MFVTPVSSAAASAGLAARVLMASGRRCAAAERLGGMGREELLRRFDLDSMAGSSEAEAEAARSTHAPRAG